MDLSGKVGYGWPTAGASKTTNTTNDSNSASQKLPHYSQEVTDFFKSLPHEFLAGNVLKYVVRCEQAGRRYTRLNDIDKAIAYVGVLQEAIAECEACKRPVAFPPGLLGWQTEVVTCLLEGDLVKSLSILACARQMSELEDLPKKEGGKKVGHIVILDEPHLIDDPESDDPVTPSGQHQT
jgi:hypothetical protein